MGKSAVFDLEDEWGYSNHITRLRLPTELLPKFVAYQLLYLWESGYFRFHSKQHVNQASISTRTLTTRVPLLVAPVPDQERIIAEIDKTWGILDSVGVAISRAVAQLGRYEDRTILDATTGRLVPQEHELAARAGRDYVSGAELFQRIIREGSPGTEARTPVRSRTTYVRLSGYDQHGLVDAIPPGWALARVDEVGEVTLGKKREPSSHIGPHMRPYLRVANVYENRIDVTDVLEMNFPPGEYETYRLQYGDILLNEGQSPELVGRPAMYRDELSGSCFQMTLLRFRAHAGISSTFALLVFRAYLRQGRFREAARWTTNIAHLSTRRFAAMMFPLPPLEEQERIVEEASRRLTAAEELSSTFINIGERVQEARFVTLNNVFLGASPLGPGHQERTAGISASRHQLTEEVRNPPMKRITSDRRNAGRTPFTEVLAAAEGNLRPRELFDQSGFSEEFVDEFYAELRRSVLSGEIVERRDSDGEPALALFEVEK